MGKLAVITGVILGALCAIAQAHRPIFSDKAATDPNTAVLISQPAISQVIYREITNEADQVWLAFDVNEQFELFIQIGVPVLDRLKEFRPAMVVVGPDLPKVELPFKLPEEVGAKIFLTDTIEDPRFFHEHFTGTDSWILRSDTVKISKSGRYYLVAYVPSGDKGKLWLSVGKKESFGVAEWAQFAEWKKRIRTFHEVSETGQGLRIDVTRQSRRVRLMGHSLVDNEGPFLGLGTSYFTALWRYRNDRPRWESDMRFISRQGFNYIRILSMVGWYKAWEGLEIAPVGFISREGKHVEAWPDYWKALAGLVDATYDKYGMRTQITIFADAQLMPKKTDRIRHMQRMLSEVIEGMEHKIILIEVANEAWQNGFPGDEGMSDLREFTRYLANRTDILVATTSNHESSFETLYRDSAADIATWHFSRNISKDDGWRPVIDCRRLSEIPGCPPVSSNEPIGPGASVATESDPIKLVFAAAYAYASRLPMYVFHSEAGVFGKTRFEDTPAIRSYCHIAKVLPNDLANWTAVDENNPNAPIIAEGCISMACSQKGQSIVCVPVGIRKEGMTLVARKAMRLRVTNLLTGEEIQHIQAEARQRIHLSGDLGAVVLLGDIPRLDGEAKRDSHLN